MLLGIDIGGTKTILALANESGEILAKLRFPSRMALGPDAYLDDMICRADAFVQESGCEGKVEGVGVCCGGPLDREKGLILSGSTLPGWTMVPIRKTIEDAFGAPMNFDNDATAAGYAEALFGAGKGTRDMAYFTVSTGIGGGIISGGKPFRGAGNAAEFGHQTLDVNGPVCPCGKRGCLQGLASGTAIGERARHAAEERPTRMIDLAGGEIRRITAETAAEAAQLGDPVALNVWEETGKYLGQGISNVINILNPDLVVLGGGVTKAGELLFEPTRRYAKLFSMPELYADCRIVPATLGDDVGIHGAIALAMEI